MLSNSFAEFAKRTTSSDCFLQKKLGRYVSSLEKEKNLKQLDRVSESHQLIYYVPMESYLAIYNKQLPGLRPQHHFKQGEVKKVDFKLNPWNNATYKLGNQTSLILPDYFKTPFEFHQMFDSEKNKY
uniref:Uncharacterized protein n=1 Tax=Glossina pallidipes TaxID=7398 RepID=A0A1A9ZP67_GLOPL